MALMTPKLVDPRVETARDKVRIAAALRRLSYADIALQCGLSRNAISQFIAGRTSLSYQNMLKLCDVIGVPIGLIHVPDSITEGRIRLHRALVSLPPHLAQEAFDAIAQPKGRGDAASGDDTAA